MFVDCKDLNILNYEFCKFQFRNPFSFWKSFSKLWATSAPPIISGSSLRPWQRTSSVAGLLLIHLKSRSLRHFEGLLLLGVLWISGTYDPILSWSATATQKATTGLSNRFRAPKSSSVNWYVIVFAAVVKEISAVLNPWCNRNLYGWYSVSLIF